MKEKGPNPILSYIRQTFGFSKNETYGTLLLLIFITIALLLPYLLDAYQAYHQLPLQALPYTSP